MVKRVSYPTINNLLHMHNIKKSRYGFKALTEQKRRRAEAQKFLRRFFTSDLLLYCSSALRVSLDLDVFIACEA